MIKISCGKQSVSFTNESELYQIIDKAVGGNVELLNDYICNETFMTFFAELLRNLINNKIKILVDKSMDSMKVDRANIEFNNQHYVVITGQGYDKVNAYIAVYDFIIKLITYNIGSVELQSLHL
ncbi:MAG: hypothetical protein EOO60_01835 [Hymenobacter sp.]|nr:MAG: hypothetical protein EOO60_01835 [Hymenobacter sp.]